MALRSAAGCLVGLALAFAQPAVAATPPGGVYAIIAANTPAQDPVATQALQVPGVDGLLIHLRWADISPATKQYNWTTLDRVVQIALAANKRFEIGIETGSQTPAWMFTPKSAGGMGAPHATFTVDAFSAEQCYTFDMAPPYSAAYLSAFNDMLAQLAKHLRRTGAYKHLSMIKLSGITTTTDELRLPAVGGCEGANSVQLWQSLGYTPGKVQAAWRQMLQMYLKHFPEKAFNIGFIGVNAFPAINADGGAAPADKAKHLSAKFVAALIADASTTMPGKLAVGFDSLTFNVPSTVVSYRQSRKQFLDDVAAANARPGWQTNELLGSYPKDGAACGGNTQQNAVACANAAEFRKMLLRGVFPHGQADTPPSQWGVYLEVFPQNVVAFPAAIAPAHDKLGGWN
ncbi:MAG TPA: hypothetical protein VHL34_19955 [Rhizomicrobium sp.]|jgi:hypothetical protein|nr:hypothetical protein [Rhizomicrobium sp.]